ncbi:MAG: NAD-dependent protein deacylase [Bacilli bacterium]|nr:NAD-dependent protein deacylase [Bacilli bacterium]
MDKINKLKAIIAESSKIVLFTGAGISVPSGIPDFRSSSGLYSSGEFKNLDPEVIISKTFFDKNPKLFYEYYKKHLIYPKAKANVAHYYFSDLEKVGKLKATITQNIDNFHQESGSKNVFELHGSVHRNYCMKCKKFYDLDYIINQKDIPYCKECGGMIKPDVVLYEETLNDETLFNAIDAIKDSDCLIVVGTSLVVYPAAGLIRYFRGKNLVLINKQKTSYDMDADLVINDDIIEVIKKLQI